MTNWLKCQAPKLTIQRCGSHQNCQLAEIHRVANTIANTMQWSVKAVEGLITTETILIKLSFILCYNCDNYDDDDDIRSL